MSEEDFVEATKGALLDDLLDSVEQRFDLTDQVFIMPKELLAYFEGHKKLSSEGEKRRFHEAFDEWQASAFDSLRRRSTVERLTKFLLAMPEPLRGAVVAAVEKRIGPQIT